MDNVGLFGTTGSASEVRNVGLRAANVTGRYEVGGLVGYSNGTIMDQLRDRTGDGAVGRRPGRLQPEADRGQLRDGGGDDRRRRGRAGGLQRQRDADRGQLRHRPGDREVAGGRPDGGERVGDHGQLRDGGGDRRRHGRRAGGRELQLDDGELLGYDDERGDDGKRRHGEDDERAADTGGIQRASTPTWNVDIDGAAGTDDPWDFGTASEYPVLKVDFDGDGTASWEEFGDQRPAPN